MIYLPTTLCPYTFYLSYLQKLTQLMIYLFKKNVQYTLYEYINNILYYLYCTKQLSLKS